MALTFYDRALHLAVFSAQRLSAWGFVRRLCAIAALTLCNIAFGAAAYRFATGAPWPSALFTVYGVLLRAPGFTVRDPGIAGTIVLNAILLYSVFVFAVVLGAGIEEVKGRIAAVRSGEVGLRLQGHVLVLNWSPLVVPLLRQLAAARADPASPLHRRPVVLLADAPKPAMDAQLAEALKGIKIELYSYSGQPWRLGDLERVSAAEAACIMLLEPPPPAAPAASSKSGGSGSAKAEGEFSYGRGARGVTSGGAGAASQRGVASGAQQQQGRAEGGSPGAAEAVPLQQALKAAALMALLSLLDPASTDDRRTGGGGPGISHARPPTSTAWRLLQALMPVAVRGRLATLAPRWLGRRAAMNRRTPRVLVQVPSVGGTDYAHLVRRSANRGGVRGLDITLAESSLNQSSLLDRLVAQTALQPGLASVAREALRQGPGSPAFRYATVGPGLGAATVGDAWRLCRAAGAWLVGVVSAADSKLVLNPSPQRAVLEGDQLVALARGADILPRRAARRRAALLARPITPSTAPRALSRASTMSSSDLAKRPTQPEGSEAASASDVAAAAAQAAAAIATETRWLPIRVIVAGCGAARHAGLLEGFKQHAPPGSSVVFVSSEDGAAAEAAGSSSGAPEGRRPSRPLPAEVEEGGNLAKGSVGGALWSSGGCEGAGNGGEAAAAAAAAAAALGAVPLSAVAVQDIRSARPISAEALLAAGLAEADALVLASTAGGAASGPATQAADAQLLCELLAVQEALEALESSGIRTHGGGSAAGDVGPDSGCSTAPEPWGEPPLASRRQSSGGGVAWRRCDSGMGLAGEATGLGGGSGADTGQLPRRGLHVVCLVRSYGLRRTAQAFLQGMARRSFSFELLIADELVSAALVQIVTHPCNGLVFERLLGQRRGGPQLKMIPAAAFGFGSRSSSAVPSAAVTFGEVAEQLMVRCRAATVGYRRADGRLLLAPAPDEAIKWTEGDELVVIKD